MSTDLAPVGATHEALDRAELMISQGPPLDAKLFHHFADGMYARELHIPAGAILTGKIHRHQNINVLLKGRMKVGASTEALREIVAPAIFVAPPGTRRIGYAIEDSVWVCFHATKETELDKIEAEQIVPHRNPLLEQSQTVEELL